MLKRYTHLIKDNETRCAIEFIQEEALGKAVELSAVPTSAVPLLQSGEWGFYAGILYFRMENIIYVVTPSSTITIT